mgnify:CR=1 FL=1
MVQVKTKDGDKVATCTISIVGEALRSVNLTPSTTSWIPGAIEWSNGHVNTTGTSYTRDWVYSPFIEVGGFDTITFSILEFLYTVPVKHPILIPSSY